MFRSIRWTLQLWHGVILLTALVSFGAALYVGVSRARFNAVDAELRGAARLIGSRIGVPQPPRPSPPERRPPPPRRGRDGVDDGNSPPPRRPLDDLFDPDGPPDGNRPPPPEDSPGDAPDDAQRRPRRDPVNLELPRDMLRRPGVEEADQPYFVVWTPDGQAFRASMDLASLPPSLKATTPLPAGQGPDPNVQFRQSAGVREVIQPAPLGMRVLVGRSVQREQAELRSLLYILTSAGAGVMLVGLAGGWLLARRATKPIQTIAVTARAISASDLARRIDVADTKSELGSLANTLNDTFARLEAAFRQQTRFTADASHELRTPLSVMHSHLELALSRERTGEEYRNSLSTCLRASRRMKSLVESLLVLARADAGRLELRREPFDVADVVSECESMLRPLAEQRGLTLEVDLKPATVVGDKNRVAQVVTNLMNNAIAYNRDGGRVRVEVFRDGRDAILTVADTGVGIAAEEQPHIFERFFRADKARTREAGGSGLGLAICKSIIDAHDGKIAFNSRADEGTTFTIRLPSNG